MLPSTEDTIFPRTDHDLLIEVSANVKNLTSALHQYNSSNLAITQDHEGRIRMLESDNQQLHGSQKGTRNLMVVLTTLAGCAVAIATFAGLHK